jgi:hypothetical protein
MRSRLLDFGSLTAHTANVGALLLFAAGRPAPIGAPFASCMATPSLSACRTKRGNFCYREPRDDRV